MVAMKNVAYASMLLVLLITSALPSVLREMRCDGLTRASWRFQAASVILLPCAVAEARITRDTQWLSKLANPRVALALLTISALFVFCFSGFSFALSLTSMSHAVLFPGLHPLYVALWGIANGERTSAAEVGGVLLTLSGMALALREAGAAGEGEPADADVHTRSPTLLGDALSVANGAAFAAFIVISRHLRTDVGMPLFGFQAAWTLIAMLLSLPLPIALGDASGACGIVAWATRGSYWPQVLFLAIGMGVVAQGCIAFAFKHLRSLVISLSLVAQARVRHAPPNC
jgi:drug/metabolite transporter (DMT)-like permease